jgi:hypothetical protein
MKPRIYFLTSLISLLGCQDLPFRSHGGNSNTSGGVDAGVDSAGGSPGANSEFGSPSGGPGSPDSTTSFFPGFLAPDAASQAGTNTEDIVDAGVFSIPVPWDVDASPAGTDGGGLPFSFPDPSSLPAATEASKVLALAGDVRTIDVGVDGCGEPSTCYLRTIIATFSGHVYAARMSTDYPTDTCVTKTIDCDHAVLVGDPTARFGDDACRAGTPQISVGFLVPQSLLFGWNIGQVWESTAGFRSEWELVNAGGDSGSYEPIPGRTAKLWPAWSRYYWGGEIYGELLVPLRHTKTHAPAIGFALFDIRVRQ